MDYVLIYYTKQIWNITEVILLVKMDGATANKDRSSLQAPGR
jgi:hypothetical protein